MTNALHTVRVRLSTWDPAAFARLSLTLHRRGVRVLSAHFARMNEGEQEFSATFECSHGQAVVAAATLRRVIGVLDVDLVEAAEDGPFSLR